VSEKVVAFHPEEKRPQAKSAAPPPSYAELAVTSNFSFLRGASSPEDLVKAAGILGHAGMGIADRNSVAGVVRVHVAAKEINEEIRELNRQLGTNEPELKIAVGARLAFSDETPDMLAYPRDRAAWGRLTRLLSLGKRRAEKGDCILGLPDLLEFVEGLNLIVMPPARIHADRLHALLLRLKQAASKNAVWLAAGMLYRGDDLRRLKRIAAIAEQAFVPLIAVNDVLYHAPECRRLQDVVTCIREHLTLETAGRTLEANAERHLKSSQEMARLFRLYPNAVAETLHFLESCKFSLEELRGTEYADETRQGYATPQEALVAFAEEGFKKRFPNGAHPKVRHALNEELRLIGKLNYAPFFLTVDEIVKFARSKNILCQGRGSAANSIICYCLGVTDVSPEKIDLLFERFVSEERNEPPDIDVDFEHERREEVIQHIYEKYGRERAGIAATVICYRGRSAIREVGKVFGLSEDTISALAGTLWGWSSSGVSDTEARRAGLDPSDPRLQQVMELAEELIGAPRHLSQHVGGFVITRNRLDEVVPIENAAMDDRTVIEWEKDDLDSLGLLKVDVLALGMLSCLRRGFDFLQSHYGVARNLAMQDEDKATYKMIQRADTIGVFQIESRAQMSMLPRLQPKEFYDLVIEVAIVRPGPIQGNMVHPYLRRREELRDKGIQPTYPGPSPAHGDKDELREVLKKTLGVPLFQEHAMRIAIVAAGFKPGEADRLRRAMATFKRVGTIGKFRDKFINGMTARGYDPTFATNCWDQIEGFGSYGFPESHAASFANLVYASAWMKCHYPDVFAAALLNSQPMGFYATAQLVRDAQEHGVEVRAVDVNLSNWDCTLEAFSPVIPEAERSEAIRNPDADTALASGFRVRAFSTPRNDDGRKREREPRLHLNPRHASMEQDISTTHALRLGLREITGFSEDWAKKIESARGVGFDSIRDLWLRTGLPPKALEKLAHADAFNSLGLNRRDALWAIKALRRAGDRDDLPLFARAAMPQLEPDADLPPMLPGQQVVEDYRHLSLSLKAHPVSFLRADLDARGILRHELLPNMPSGRRVTVAGLVLVRQRPGTGNAIFITLEDETAVANAILWPRTFEAYRPVIMGARLISITGMLQNEKGVIHIVAEHFEDLSPLLRSLSDDRPRLPRIIPDIVEQVLPKGRNFH
jgi:error-prone DNA polymerase